MTYCDETRKGALNSQTARAKENPNWATMGTDKETNITEELTLRWKFYAKVVI